jgi:hypothetical protein
MNHIPDGIVAMSEGNVSTSQETNNRFWQSSKSVFMVLMAYVLSFGPAYSTTHALFGISSCEPVLKVYNPVIWLAEFTILETVLGYYMMMWIWVWGAIIVS